MLLVLFGEPEVSYFGHVATKEHIGCLDVSMDDLLVEKILESLVELKDDLVCLLDWLQGSPLGNEALEGAPVAQLSDYITVVIRCQDFITLENVDLVQALEDLDLRGQQVGEILGPEGRQVDYLDGHHFI